MVKSCIRQTEDKQMRLNNSVNWSWTCCAMLLALTFVHWPNGAVSPVHAVEVDCVEGDESIECRAQAGDRGAIYVLGRRAYDNARESGDFSEALRLSRQLTDYGDKNGKRLLKMVHMQLGWGAHNDYVEAYGWLSEGIAGGDDYLVRWRGMLADKMTPDQLEQAKELTAD
jgi:hypothetical protein